MTRWLLALLLLLSLGLNAGLLASWAWRRGAVDRPPASAVDGGGPGDGGPDAGEGPGGRMPFFIERMADGLDLAGESRQAFLERQTRFFEETMRARARLVRLQRELRAELTADEPDRRAVDALLDELTEAHRSLERAFVDNLLDTREILDPAQERRYMRFLHHLRHRDEMHRRFGRDRWRDRHGPGPWSPPRERRGPPQR